MNRDQQDKKLHNALINFVKESIPHLRKNLDPTRIPSITRYELKEDRGRKKIKKVDRPNWWQTSKYMNPIVKLSTYKDAVAVCRREHYRFVNAVADKKSMHDKKMLDI